MARRGCASGRRKQLRRLVKALHEVKEFDPSIFDRAAPTPPPPPPSYYQPSGPKTEGRVARIISAPAPRSRAPARPIASDVAPVRLPTRPLPVWAQVKKRGMEVAKSSNKPVILSIERSNFDIRKRGNRILIKGRIPPIPHDRKYHQQ